MFRGMIGIQDITSLKNVLRQSFSDVRSELDDHLESINQNSSEITNLYAFLRELDSKIDKLTDRVDELTSLFQPNKDDFSNVKLSRQEQEVFLVLFSQEGPITPTQAAKKLGLSSQLAAQYLYNLQLKGVPLLARNWNGELFYSLDLKFKDLQLRKNVLGISPALQHTIISLK